MNEKTAEILVTINETKTATVKQKLIVLLKKKKNWTRDSKT